VWWRKGPITIGTAVWFLFCMDSHVLYQSTFTGKRFHTCWTCIRLLPCMSSYMISMTEWRREGLMTIGTTVWFLFSMDSYVPYQSTFKGKRFNTYWARKRLLTSVNGSFHTKSAAPRSGPSQIKIIFCTYVKINEKLTQPKFFVAMTSVAWDSDP
jgi:hypothetical protein